MERPERYKDYPEQYRYTSQSWISESSIRDVTEQLESVDLENPDSITRCLLDYLYLSYQWGTFHEFIDDFDNTKLGIFFAAREEQNLLHEKLIKKAWDSIDAEDFDTYENTLQELKSILGHEDPTFISMEWEAADSKSLSEMDLEDIFIPEQF